MSFLRTNRPARILALAAALALAATAAWAYWVAPSNGQANGTVGALAAPGAVGASAANGGSSVSVTWTASPTSTGPAPSGYYAERWSGGTATVAGGNCGTPAAPIAGTSCTDSGVADGTYTYTVLAVYRSWTASSAHSAPNTVARDTAPPATTLATEPATPSGSNGWFKQSSVVFTLGASDSGSGVAETFYTVDGGEAHPYTSGVTISTAGDHTIAYWSTDRAGNEETHHQTHVKIDGAAPETTLALHPAAPNGSNGWYTSAPTFTLAASDGTSGVATTSYEIDGGSAKTYGGAVAIPAGQHTVTYYSTDNAGNVESAHTSAQVNVDTSPPSDSVSLGASPVHAFQSGGTIYFANALGGSFTLLDTVGDSGSGPASATFPQLAATNWSHAAETVTSPAGGPFSSSAYSWSANAGTPGAAEANVTSADVAGNKSTGSGLSFVADSAAPTGGALSVNGANANAGGTTSSSTTTSFPIASRTDYTEAKSATQSGLASSVLTVQSEPFARNSCGEPGSAGPYTSPTVITGTSNPPITGGYCYLYTLTGTDKVGNATSISTTVKVDTTAPTNSLSLGTASHAFLSGTTLYYEGNAAGSFTLVNAVSDANSGPASAIFPALTQTKWTHEAKTVTTPAEGPYTSNTYSWSTGALEPTGSQVRFTSTDAAGNTSAGTTLTFVSDTSAPTGGTLVVNGTAANSSPTTSYTKTTSFAISSRTDYTETQSSTRSGLESSVLTVQSETLSKNTCGTPAGAYASPTPIAGTANPAITAGYCYLYKLTGTDNVGNSTSVSTVVKVDTTAPTNSLSLGSGSNAFLNGTTLYFNSGTSGSFTLVNTVSDGETGPASAIFPALSASKWTHAAQTVTSPSEGPFTSAGYTWSAGAATPSGAETQFTSTDNAGNTSAATTLTFAPDTAGPAGGSVSAPARATGSVPVTFGAGTDPGSGVSSSLDEILRAEASYTAATDSCGSFGGFTTKLSPGGSPYSDTSISNTKCYEYEYVASDNVGNTTTYGPTSAVKPGPKALSVTALNGTGATKHKIDAKDVITFTFSEGIEPASITSAWSAASQPQQTVTVTFKDPGSGNGTNMPDSFSVTTAGVHLGSVQMSNGGWVPTKGGSYSFTAGMTFGAEGGKSLVTLTLESLQSGGTSEGTVASTDEFTWTPDEAITDLGGTSVDPSPAPANKAEHF